LPDDKTVAGRFITGRFIIKYLYTVCRNRYQYIVQYIVHMTHVIIIRKIMEWFLSRKRLI